MTIQSDFLEDLPNDGIAPRMAALAILSQVLGQKKMLDSVLDREGSFLSLEPRDRAFVRMLVATVLRRKGQLDDLIARTLDKEAPRPETLKWILYIGIAQILFMDVANHAAVDTSVTLTEEQGMGGKKGFVNAILRRMTQEGRTWVGSQDAAALNMPPWLYKQWTDTYGIVRAKDIALASLTEASLDITVKDASKTDEWALNLAAKTLPTGSLRRPSGGHVRDLKGFQEGEWWIQDASSALPAKLFGDISGKTILDLCAAPGGKTMQLASMGANVVALDRSATRMAQLTENIARTNLSDRVQTIIEDGSVWKPREKFSHILLDAPCTATGTIRRHPDLLALKVEKDQDGLLSIQERLLLNAADILEIGGILIYCTCSLQKAEGERQIETFLENRTDMKRIPFRCEEFSGLDGFINGQGDIRIFPHLLKDVGGMDGFFISRIQKKP